MVKSASSAAICGLLITWPENIAKAIKQSSRNDVDQPAAALAGQF